jgi:hypothetical protein
MSGGGGGGLTWQEGAGEQRGERGTACGHREVCSPPGAARKGEGPRRAFRERLRPRARRGVVERDARAERERERAEACG